MKLVSLITEGTIILNVELEPEFSWLEEYPRDMICVRFGLCELEEFPTRLGSRKFRLRLVLEITLCYAETTFEGDA